MLFTVINPRLKKKKKKKLDIETKAQDEEQAIRELDKDVQNIPKEMLATDGEDKPAVAEQKEDKIEGEGTQKDKEKLKEKIIHAEKRKRTTSQRKLPT